MLAGTHDDVAGFKVMVNEVARMDVLQAVELPVATAQLSPGYDTENITYQLASKEQDSFQRELKITFNKEVIKRWAKAFDHHCIEASFCTKPMCARDTDAFAKLCVNTNFVVQGMDLPFQ